MRFHAFLKSSLSGDLLVRRTPGFYGRFRTLIADSGNASADTRRAMQRHLTTRTLRLASTTAFSRKWRLTGPYDARPILIKDRLRDEGRSLERATWLPTYRAETGGTTGIPIALRRSWSSVVFEQAMLDHLAERYSGIVWRRARVAVLRGDTIQDPSNMTPPFWRPQHGGRYLVFSSNHLNANTVSAYIEALKDFKPDMLWVYPTSLEALCRLGAEKVSSVPELRIIVSSSEVLPRELSEEASHIFGVPVLDYYGQAERVCLSYCANGKDHFFSPAYGRVELRHDYDDEIHSLYEIIGTSYWNAAQPLIRYATGDLARLPKGLSAAEIEEITLGLRPFYGVAGRQSDYLVSAEGGHLMGIDHIPRGVPDVAQMQFHQYSPTHVEIHVVPLPGYSEATKSLIRSKARQKIPKSMHIDIVTVHSLQRTARGKAPLVVRTFSE